MVCGQSEHHYNRNEAFNLALAEAKGVLVVFCAGDGPFPDRVLADIVANADDCTANHTVLVNPNGADRETIHTVALSREAAISVGGLDESAYFAGANSGPYELVARLKGQRWTIRQVDSMPPPEVRETVSPQRAMSTLIREIWPTKFSPYRVMPLRENPELTKLRSRRS